MMLSVMAILGWILSLRILMFCVAVGWKSSCGTISVRMIPMMPAIAGNANGARQLIALRYPPKRIEATPPHFNVADCKPIKR